LVKYLLNIDVNILLAANNLPHKTI